jgi:hypothetical protein
MNVKKLDPYILRLFSLIICERNSGSILHVMLEFASDFHFEMVKLPSRQTRAFGGFSEYANQLKALSQAQPRRPVKET